MYTTDVTDFVIGCPSRNLHLLDVPDKNDYFDWLNICACAVALVTRVNKSPIAIIIKENIEVKPVFRYKVMRILSLDHLSMLIITMDSSD